MLPVRPTPAPTPPRRGGRLFIVWLVGVLVIIGAETGRRVLREALPVVPVGPAVALQRVERSGQVGRRETIDAPGVKGYPKGLMRATVIERAGPNPDHVAWFHTTTIGKATYASFYVDSRKGEKP